MPCPFCFALLPLPLGEGNHILSDQPTFRVFRRLVSCDSWLSFGFRTGPKKNTKKDQATRTLSKFGVVTQVSIDLGAGWGEG